MKENEGLLPSDAEFRRWYEDNVSPCFEKGQREYDPNHAVFGNDIFDAYKAGYTRTELKPEGQRTKIEELEALYASLFNQLNPVMEANKRLVEVLGAIIAEPYGIALGDLEKAKVALAKYREGNHVAG